MPKSRGQRRCRIETRKADWAKANCRKQASSIFLEGEWAAVCRSYETRRQLGRPGTLKATKILDGCASIEFFEGPYQGEIIKGLGLRAFNPKSRCWEHTWTDTASPGGFLVWRGRFKGGRIDLFGEWDDDSGQRILSQLTWSHITGHSAHWESHRSLDGGKTWTKHWVIDFTRKGTKK
ncbi:MAG: hypothetical protein HS126_37750 [Anaerolineales bacterium]|nr:hypothetical protein [Anaerolineales bacterium]